MVAQASPFKTPMQEFQFYDKYSRWNEKENRRETWHETVKRAVDFLWHLAGGKLSEVDYKQLYINISNMAVMPSMRLLAMAGPAALRDNTTIYNCSAQGVDSIDAFVEALLISMSGCGVGYSVESKFVDKLPEIYPQMTHMRPANFLIPDSTEGWGQALRYGLESWFKGMDVEFDYRAIRPEGVPLKIKGGTASGPQPLKDMLDFARAKILSRQGKRLTTLDAHDIMCMIGKVVISGGVRRSAMCALFDATDTAMLTCKNIENIAGNEQRWSANNSFVITYDMSEHDVMKLFDIMLEAGTGEPGMFNRAAMERMKPVRRKSALWLTNPCFEIVLRPNQFCNLSTVRVTADDTEATLIEKVKWATAIGTIQSTATYFPNLRPIWKENCEEERLLGVDITGQRDSNILTPELFRKLKAVARATNAAYAAMLGIAPSAAVTCVKPNGNSSVLMDTASGLHPRHSQYYIRNVRVGAKTPLHKVMVEAGVPMVPENGQTIDNATTWVVGFPTKSPEWALTADRVGAIEQCEWWKINKLNWTEHNPSITVTYTPQERAFLREWVRRNIPILGGMSFLPKDETVYANMPYVKVTKEEYEALIDKFPAIDFSRIFELEAEMGDTTKATKEYACVNNVCELV